MANTKRLLIEGAFTKLGLASYVFDLQAEDLQSALGALNNMMAAWGAHGIRIGYPQANTAIEDDLEADCPIPLYAKEAIVYNLALRIAPDYGKTPSPAVSGMAQTSYNMLLVQTSSPPPTVRERGGLPRGAGSGWQAGAFTRDDPLALNVGKGADLEF